MRTEYLREFVVFSRHLSFTEAAKELFIACLLYTSGRTDFLVALGRSRLGRKGREPDS